MSDMSKFTMSPTILPFPANEFRGDFQALFFTGPRTATGTPRRVIVMGSARFSISCRRARHLALKSVALTTRVFMGCNHYDRPFTLCRFGKPEACSTAKIGLRAAYIAENLFF